MTSKVIQFLYYHPIEVTVLEGLKLNLPMFRSSIKVFKGVSNVINFELKDSDRHPVKILNGQFQMYVFDEETDAVILTKFATIVDEEAGKYRIILNSGDIQQYGPGYYRFSVVYTNFDDLDQMLYTDLAQGVIGQIEIVDNAFPKFIPATVVNASDFKIQVISGNSNYVTGRYPGDAQDNIQNGLHTVALYLNNFTGSFWVQGSLEDMASQDSHYFDIELNGQDPYVFTNFTGIQEFQFEGNFVWVRFRYLPDLLNTGSITQLLYKH